MSHPFRSILSLLAAGMLALLATGCSPQAKLAKHTADADKYFAAADYDRAEVEYINVLGLEALNPHAISQLAIIYFEQGRIGRAAPFINKARELQPNNLEIRLKLGSLYLITGKAAEARAEANFVLDRRPQDEDAPILLVEASAKPEEIEAAQNRLKQLPAPAADGAPALTALGSLELRRRQLAPAEELFGRARTQNPKYGTVYAALGTLYQARNDLPQAEQAFKQAAEFSPLRSPRQLLYPRLKIQTGQIEAGRQALVELARKAPDYIPPTLLLAEIAMVTRKYDDALALIAKVLARDSLNPDALLLQGRIRVAKGDTDKALAEADKLLQIYPRLPQAYFQLAMARIARGEIDLAASSLNRAISVRPDYAEAIVALAELNLKKGDYLPAINALKPLVQKHPENIPARLLLADAYRSQGDFDAALAEYQRLEAIFPRAAQVSLLRGIVFLQQGKRTAAREAFEKALELTPDFLPALEQLTNLDLADKNFTAALERLASAKNPQRPELYLLQAKIYAIQKDIPKAEAVLRKVIAAQPNSPEAYLLLARLYVGSGQVNDALANYQAVSAKDPKNIEALMLTGLINEQKKDYAAARQAYERLLAVDPNSAPALNNLACLYAEHFDQLGKAYDLAQHARELVPHEGHITDSLGWILYQQRQFPRALNLIRESAAKLPDSAAVQFHLGMASYMMGEEDAARRALSKALELDAGLPEAADARQCLAILAIDGATGNSQDRTLIETAAAKTPADPVALSRLAAFLERDGNTAKALSAYESALQANPNNLGVLLQLIRLESARNNAPKALELAKTARTLAPENPTIAYALGRLIYQTGDFRWALSLFQEAVRNNPDNADMLYDLAEASYRNGQLADAREAAERALQVNPLFLRAEAARRFLELSALVDNPAGAPAAAEKIAQALQADPDYIPALMVSGIIAEQKSDLPGARRTYERIVERCPDFGPAKKRLAALNNKKAEPKK